MPLEQKPFRKYHEEKKADTFTVKLNEVERKRLERFKALINQPKDSTAIKQLAWIGSKVLLDELTAAIIDTITENKRKNDRLNIFDYEGSIKAKVQQIKKNSDTFVSDK